MKIAFRKKPSSIAQDIVLWCIGFAFFVWKLHIVPWDSIQGIVSLLFVVLLFGMLPLLAIRMKLPYIELFPHQITIRSLFRKKIIPFDSILNIDKNSPERVYLSIRMDGCKVKRLRLPVLCNFHSLIDTLEKKLGSAHSLEGLDKEALSRKERQRQLYRKSDNRNEKSRCACFFPKKGLVELFFFAGSSLFFILVLCLYLVMLGFLLFDPPNTEHVDTIVLISAMSISLIISGGIALYSRNRKRLSIVTFAPDNMQIQMHWEAPIYKIPYLDIRSVELVNADRLSLMVNVKGEERRVLLPIEFFHKTVQKKLIAELRKRTI